MSSEVEVPETPNWLKELEAKREKRLKAKLGHEAGAGAPCLKCGEKCPGLDLHFWRKCCKICRCSKEEHEVQDDDIYGWTEFQLLGSKPSKIKKKIVLPGKKDELELDWAPKGHNDVVDKYLKTLPPEQLPIKGSQAAQDRKQQLQKQIPVHDIDPTLCHELTEDELNKMNEYIAHVKNSSVGVGQIVNLSSIIKGNLHMLNPNDAALIASRYPKGIPLSEIVKLQSMSKVDPLKQHNLSQNLQNMTIKNKTMMNRSPNNLNAREETASPIAFNKIHDINYAGYTSELNALPLHPQYSNSVNKNSTLNNPSDDSIIKTNPYQDENIQNIIDMPTRNFEKHFQPNPYYNSPKSLPSNINDGDNYKMNNDLKLNEKFLQNSNFNPKNLPSQFINQHMPIKSNIPNQFVNEQLHGPNPPFSDVPKDPPNYTGSAFVPYSKTNTNLKIGSQYSTENPSYTPNHSKNLNSPIKNVTDPSSDTEASEWGRAQQLPKHSQGLPHYVPAKYNSVSESQQPVQIPKNVKDLAFSTYDSQSFPPPEGQRDLYHPYSKIHTHGQEHSNNAETPALQQWNNVQNPVSTIIQDQGARNNTQNPVLPRNLTMDPMNNIQNSMMPNIQNQETWNKTHNPLVSRNLAREPWNNIQDPMVPNIHDQKTWKNTQNPILPRNTVGEPWENIQNPETYKNMHNPDLQGTAGGEQLNDIYTPGSHQQHNALGGSPVSNYKPLSNQLQNQPLDKKMFSNIQPGNLPVTEDFLEPSLVSVGAIQDINYPEIKSAVHGTNDFYEDYSPDSIKEILNNVKLPDCHYCKKPFEEKEFAVTIDRANVLFHAACFKCAGCNQNLADNLYFYSKENNNIYCGRDYAKIRGIPRCKACDELIFTKEYCLAEDSTFHLKHFCCTECDKPLAGQDYVLGDDDGMPYCLPCFERSKADSCSSCDKVIKTDETGCNLNGVHFHADDHCFACKVCQKPLLGQKLLLRNKKLYCSHQCYGTEQ